MLYELTKVAKKFGFDIFETNWGIDISKIKHKNRRIIYEELGYFATENEVRAFLIGIAVLHLKNNAISNKNPIEYIDELIDSFKENIHE